MKKLLLIFVGLCLSAMVQGQYPKVFWETFDLHPFSPRIMFEQAEPDRIVYQEGISRLGAGCVKVTLVPGDFAAHGHRAELKIFNEDALNQEVWYSWSIMVPESYQDTVNFGKQIFSQFHMLPDFDQGEDWGTYDAEPMLVLIYNFNGEDRHIYIHYGLKYENEEPVAQIPVEKGRWYDFTFQLKWSKSDSGFVQAWVNREKVTPFNGEDHKVYGRNMYNYVPPYLKMGLYRAEEVTTTNTIYIDELRIGNTYEEVNILNTGIFNDTISDLRFFPNPVNGFDRSLLYFQIPVNDDLSVRIIDTEGRVHRAKTYPRMKKGHQQINLELNDLTNGIYIVQVGYGQKIKTGKLILLR